MAMTRREGYVCVRVHPFFDNFTLQLKLGLGIDLWSGVKYQSNQNIFEISNVCTYLLSFLDI